jgi:hypothetical protein
VTRAPAWRATHAAQTHALPAAAGGTRASSESGIATFVHQHGSAVGEHVPVPAPHAIAQRLGSPHSGQRLGSGSAMR